MFNSARIKLTAWYLLIIMVISIAFSLVIYQIVSQELYRVRRLQSFRQQNRIERLNIDPDLDINTSLQQDADLWAETRLRLAVILILANVAILLGSASAAYFLAGMTLKPIRNMVDEQKRFVTDASHELRTPITSLKSEIEVNLRDKKLTLADAKKILLSNLEEVNALQLLTDRLIKLTQYQKGGNNLLVSNVSLTQITEDAVKKVSIFARRKGIKIKNNTANINIEGDRQSLTELIVILVDNAIKYSHSNTKVTIGARRIAPNVEISVKDEGKGISPEEQEHLYDRFYRSDKSRSKKDASGYGLGLAIAKQIVEKHNGEISLKSSPKTGSTFFVKIPIKHHP